MTIDWGLMLAGLGVFLLGMNYLEDALRGLMNQSSVALLRRGTASLWTAVPLGALLTGLMQSSSLVGLLVLAFVGAGVMPMRNALGIILGANLGTTMTGWLVTLLGFKFDLASASLPMIGVGALSLVLVARSSRAQAVSGLVLGLGLLLFGLDAMKQGVASLTAHADIGFLAGMHSLWFLLAGLVLAAVIQSSSAVVMLVLSGLHAGLLPLPLALAMVIGADVGTSSTLLLASAGGARVKRQVAAFHLIYNLVCGVCSYLVLLPIAPSVFAALDVSDPLYALVLFHSSFNFIGIFLFLPWLSRLADWLEQHVGVSLPSQPLRQQVPASVPDAALIMVEQQCRTMVTETAALLAQAVGVPARDGDAVIGEGLAGYINGYEQLKVRESSLVEYVGDIQASNPAQRQQLQDWLACARLTVYATKAIKDVRDDIEQMWSLDEPALASIRQALADATVLLLKALHRLLETGLGPGDMEAMAGEHRQRMVALQETLYRLRPIAALNVSTLMNVAREMDECGRELERLMRRWPVPATRPA